MKNFRKRKYHVTREFFPLLDQAQLRFEQKKYLKEHLGEDQFEKVQQLMSFYFKLQLQETNMRKSATKRQISVDNPQLLLGSLMKTKKN